MVTVVALASAGVQVGAEPLAPLRWGGEEGSHDPSPAVAEEVRARSWEGGYWVEGQRRPRDLWPAEGGLLRLKGVFGRAGRTLFADPRRPGAALIASGGGARVTLVEGEAGRLLARIELEGRVEEEVWLPAGPPELSSYALPCELRAGAPCELSFEVEGSPQDLALVIRAEPGSARYGEWKDLVYYRELGRLGPGVHQVSWDGLDRTLPRRPLPPGRYRLSLEPAGVGLGEREAPRLESSLQILPR